VETIFVIGENASLLQTRALVLAKTGAATVCSTPAQLPSKMAETTAGLVVLCHTLKADQRALIVENVQTRWPAARVLQVCQRPNEEPHDSRVDGWAFGGEPATLLRRAKELLGRTVP
jgi:hypothetical protein